MNINYRAQSVWLMKYLPPKLNVMFKFNYSKYNTRRGLISIFFFGGGEDFTSVEGICGLKSRLRNAPGLIVHDGAYYRNFTVIVNYSSRMEFASLLKLEILTRVHSLDISMELTFFVFTIQSHFNSRVLLPGWLSSQDTRTK